MTKRDEMDTQTLEDAAKAAFKQAQNVYRLNYDHFPLKNTWESVDESIRDGWRKIVSAALRVGAPPLDEYEVAEALAPYFEEGFTPRDGARAVMMLIGKRLSAQAEPGYVVVPLTPTEEMIIAGCEANPTEWNEGTDLCFASDVANDVYRAMVHAALPAPATAGGEVMGWRPIETAPNNGTKHEWPYITVLVVDEDGDVTQADYKGEDGWWPANTDSEHGSRIYPTHWMPLPAPPAKESAT